MMSYYDRKGISAWSSCVVPNFITCNSFLGKCYAKVLHGFLADAMKPDAVMPVDVNEPLYIVELGVGSGKFSYLMLQALEEMQQVCDFPLRKIVYVMTDFTEANFKFWIDHPNLKVNVLYMYIYISSVLYIVYIVYAPCLVLDCQVDISLCFLPLILILIHPTKQPTCLPIEIFR